VRRTVRLDRTEFRPAVCPAGARCDQRDGAARLGRRGCAAAVAQEFGDHPETAVARMRWVRDQVARLATAEPVVAQRIEPTRLRLAA